jgi:DNA helicase-2/ATP-dependent DNA helicase PcrA
MEEDLFPSAMSMSTSERGRTTFVLCGADTCRTSGLFNLCAIIVGSKLTDSEPSRFIEEIDGQYLEYLTPAENNYRYKPMIDTDILGM